MLVLTQNISDLHRIDSAAGHRVAHKVLWSASNMLQTREKLQGLHVSMMSRTAWGSCCSLVQEVSRELKWRWCLPYSHAEFLSSHHLQAGEAKAGNERHSCPLSEGSISLSSCVPGSLLNPCQNHSATQIPFMPHKILSKCPRSGEQSETERGRRRQSSLRPTPPRSRSWNWHSNWNVAA